MNAAHEHGIIHRDLKPANIKVRDDGVVKVLDFGLAKAIDAPAKAGSHNNTQSPTITTPAMTQAGVILGTAAYMSPEQANGRVVDKRSDLWAFGCVLYEMLTGQRTFGGEDVSDTLVHVLMKEPDWSALPATTPASIRKLLRRCLEKDRNRRLTDAGGARLEIDDALTAPAVEPSPGGMAVQPAAWRRALPWALGTLAAVATVGLVAVSRLYVQQTPSDPPLRRLSIALPGNTAPTFFAVSPDGPAGSDELPIGGP